MKAIVALTESGSTALWMRRHWIGVPIFALTPRIAHPAQGCRCTATCTPLHLMRKRRTATAVLQQARGIVGARRAYVQQRRHGRCSPGGEPMGQAGGTNALKIVRVGEF